MLTRADLAERLSSADDKSSLRAFEDWFEENSWNVHHSRDEHLTAAVFRVESLLSAYNEGRLKDDSLHRAFEELASTIRPFEPSLNLFAVHWKPRFDLAEPHEAQSSSKLLRVRLNRWLPSPDYPADEVLTQAQDQDQPLLVRSHAV